MFGELSEGIKNVASRVVVLKFQEELAKRRQEVAARPTPAPVPAPIARPSAPLRAIATPMPTPSPMQQAMVADEIRRKQALASQMQQQAETRRQQIVAGDVARFGGYPSTLNLTPREQLMYEINNPTGGSMAYAPEAELPPPTSPALRQAMIAGGNPFMKPSPLTAIPGWGKVPSVLRNPAELLTSPGNIPLAALPIMGGVGPTAKILTQMAGGQLALGAVGQPFGEKAEQILGTVGAVGAPFVPAAWRRLAPLAQLARPAMEAKVAELYPPLREAAVGGEAGKWGPFGKKAAAAGAPRYVAPLPDFTETVAGVKTSENPIVRGVVGRTGVNPAVRATDPVEKGIVGSTRQRLAADDLANVSVTGSLDRFAQPVTGAEPFRVVDGEIRNLTVKPGQSVAWNDVFSHPGGYSLTPAQQEYVQTYQQVVNQTEAMRVSAGLKPRPTLADGGVYIPRQVKSIGGIELRRPSNPAFERPYEEAQQGIANGVVYDNPRSTLLLHVRNAYREVADAQFAQYMEPFGIVPKELIPEPVLQQMSDATLNRMAAERDLRATQRQMTWWRAGQKWRTQLAKATSEVKAGREPDLAAVNERVTLAQQDVSRLENRVQFYGGRASVSGALARDEKRLTFLQQWLKDTQFHLGEFRDAQTVTNRTAKLRVIERDMATWGGRTQEVAAARDAAVTFRDEAMTEYNRVKGIYSKAFAKARSAEIAKGSLFGMSEADNIPIRMWRNKFFPLETANKAIEQMGGYGQAPRGGNIASKLFELTGNEIRLSAASGDLAMPFLHGLPLAGRNPVAWAKMAFTHYFIGWVDPAFYGRFANNHLETLQAMAQHGVPVGDIEFLTAAKPGGGMAVLKPLEAVPGGSAVRTGVRAVGRQTIGRLQSDFAGGLMMARTYLWESIKPSWTGTLDELGAYVRNMTGALETKALGVGPAQRGFESFWGAFSPKLLRSTMALGYDAARFLVNPTDPRARESARSVAQLLGGMYGIYFLAGKAMGRSKDEILTGMNPLSGKRYLSYKVGNDWIGLGGQARALIQLLARGTTDPKSLLELSLRDNPILSFYNYRGAPGKTLSEALASGLTGGKITLGGYNEPTSPLSLLGHIPLSALPFVVQGVIEGQGPAANLANLLGGRTSVGTITDQKNTEAQKMFGQDAVSRRMFGANYSGLTATQKTQVDAAQPASDYASLSPDQKDQLNTSHPEWEKAQTQQTEQQYSTVDQATVVSKLMNDAKADFKAGMEQVPLQPDGPSQVAMYHSAQENYIAGMNRIERSNPKVFAEWEKNQPKTARQAVYKGYIDIFGQFSDPVTGLLPDDKKDAMFQAIDAYSAGLTDKQAADLAADIGAGDSPWLDKYHADSKTFKPYWDAEDQLWTAFQGSVKGLEAYPTYNDFYDSLVAQAVAGGMTREFVVASNMLDSFPIVKMFTSLRADYHDAQLAQNPEMARIGLHYGWISNIRKGTLPVVAGSLMGGTETPLPSGSMGQPFNWGR